MKSHDSDIELLAHAQLQGFSEMLVVDDSVLGRLSVDELPHLLDKNFANSRKCKTWLDFCREQRAHVAELQKKDPGMTKYYEEVLQGTIDSIHSQAQQKGIERVKEGLNIFMSQFRDDLTNSKSPAAYALIAMQQVCDGKPGGLDVVRLAQTKQFLDLLDVNGVRKLTEEFILPAVFVAGKNSATCAVEYVKCCEKSGKKMDAEEKKAFLQALETHLDNAFDRANGTDGEKKLASCEEGVKVLKALRKTDTFAAPKAPKGSKLYRATDGVSEALGEHQKGVLNAKEEIKSEKEEARRDAKKGFKTI